VHTLDIEAFRALFPEFANVTTYPDAVIELWWTMATNYISAYDGPLLCGDPLQAALNFLTAHLLKSSVMIAAGQTLVVVTGSRVGEVSVQTMPPPAKDGWQFWLATTPYGLQLWALLKARTAGGLYFPGLPERSAFRKVGGTFRSRL
jgi:hypothetical protein